MIENQPWRTFSIFIISTFADMQAERDYLKHFNFPRVEEELGRKRARLDTFDLRCDVVTTSLNKEQNLWIPCNRIFKTILSKQLFIWQPHNCHKYIQQIE